MQTPCFDTSSAAAAKVQNQTSQSEIKTKENKRNNTTQSTAVIKQLVTIQIQPTSYAEYNANCKDIT